MSPSQEAIQISEAFVHLVVARGADDDDVVKALRLFANGLRQRANPRIRSDSLAVLHAGIHQFPRDSAVNENTGDDERSKKVALAAFIDAEVRLKHFRRMHFFIAELGFAEDFRLELELNELFRLFPLHQNLWAFA